MMVFPCCPATFFPGSRATEKREKHAFTQLEMVRRASRVDWWAYATIITKKGQMIALDKLEQSPTQTAEELLSYLLQTSGADQVREEVLRRHTEGVAPVTPKPL